MTEDSRVDGGGAPSLEAVARVPTESATRYIAQLCKHFSHKVEATFDQERGHVRFPWGACVMDAGEEMLSLRCMAAAEEDLRRCTAVVGDHLERFAWREKLSVRWEMR